MINRNTDPRNDTGGGVPHLCNDCRQEFAQYGHWDERTSTFRWLCSRCWQKGFAWLRVFNQAA